MLARALVGRGENPLVVSADSIAVYRELPILSGAPTAEEMLGIEHAMISVRSVTDSFSAGEFAGAVHPMIDSALGSGRTVIVVGGTGLYMRAALCDLELRDPVDPGIREHWQQRLSREGATGLHSVLAGLDPDAAARIEETDGRRITRALELIESGQPPPAASSGLWGARVRHTTVSVAIEREPAELRSRIEDRSLGMFRRGVAEEVRRAEELGPSPTARAAVGWDESLRGDVDGMATKTWQLARRQRTWIRRSPDVSMLPITGDDLERPVRLLLERLTVEPAS